MDPFASQGMMTGNRVPSDADAGLVVPRTPETYPEVPYPAIRMLRVIMSVAKRRFWFISMWRSCVTSCRLWMVNSP